MKIDVLSSVGSNTGRVIPQWEQRNHIDKSTNGRLDREEDYVIIKKGRFIHGPNSHPLRREDEKFFKRVYAVEYRGRKIYWFYSFGVKEKFNGNFIGFNWLQHQRFLWMQGNHWFQKEENVRYLINIFFLALGAWIGISKL